MKWDRFHLVVLGALVVFGFQNCSPVNFSQTADLASVGSDPCTLNPADPLCTPGGEVPEWKTCHFNGQILEEGQSVVAYLNSSVSYGQKCEAETRVCKAGALSGSYNYASCAVGVPESCLFNGKTIAHGSNVTAYQSSSVEYGKSCTSEVRSCDNGTLSGSFSYSSCEVGAPSACLFNDRTIPHGQSVTAYLSSSVDFGNSCSKETRVCDNGKLSGTYTFGSCAVGAPKSCLFNGRTVAHLETVTAYASSSVDYGQSCASQTRICNNGTLSGAYSYASCSVGAPKSCLFNGQTVAHGATVVGYKAASAAVCESETRRCDNGTLTGSYGYPSCEVPCTDVKETTKYLNTMIQIFPGISNEEIARNCIDTSVPTLAKNMPTDAWSTVRFKNTCGNRYCANIKGMPSGRVIEMENGLSKVECRYEKTPATYVGSCVKEVEKSGTPLQILNDTKANILNLCADAGVDPNSLDPAKNASNWIKFFYVCGYRYCAKKGYADGRVVELGNNNAAQVHCYRDFAGSLPTVQAVLNDVANNCIDSNNPNLQTNVPSTDLQMERFMSTCGNRYCTAKGYSMGHVVEYAGTAAVLKCLKK
ncbi:hypothetical protein [Bdellovibrio sp. HCB2-146]|uniref:hypothetical protein n=1 Tax=Bdellovibrio sp. HCB2-146 TaxID=3394362 RepID=UPI0039BD75A6